VGDDVLSLAPMWMPRHGRRAPALLPADCANGAGFASTAPGEGLGLVFTRFGQREATIIITGSGLLPAAPVAKRTETEGAREQVFVGRRCCAAQEFRAEQQFCQ